MSFSKNFGLEDPNAVRYQQATAGIFDHAAVFQNYNEKIARREKRKIEKKAKQKNIEKTEQKDTVKEKDTTSLENHKKDITDAVKDCLSKLFEFGKVMKITYFEMKDMDMTLHCDIASPLENIGQTLESLKTELEKTNAMKDPEPYKISSLNNRYQALYSELSSVRAELEVARQRIYADRQEHVTRAFDQASALVPQACASYDSFNAMQGQRIWQAASVLRPVVNAGTIVGHAFAAHEWDKKYEEVRRCMALSASHKSSVQDAVTKLGLLTL